MHTRCGSVLLQFSLPPLVALLLIVLTGAYAPFTEAGTPSAAATYSAYGALSVTLPYHRGAARAPASSSPRSSIPRGARSRPCGAGRRNRQGRERATWQQTIAPVAAESAIEDVVWQRVRYRFEIRRHPRRSDRLASSRCRGYLRRPVVHILGQTEYLAGSDAAMRVLVSDASNQDAALTGTVRAELLVPQRRALLLFSGRLNHRGTVEAQFRFPAGLAGKYDLHYVADTPIGSTEFTEPIQVQEASILLTTEKPIYTARPDDSRACACARSRRP